jgi:hypothetical protein
MMARSSKLVLVKRAASLLLLLCFVLPLSKCEGRIDPDTGIRAADTIHYASIPIRAFERPIPSTTASGYWPTLRCAATAA